MLIMTEEVPPQVVLETRTLLGKYIKEPPLTDKLLSKPPFRFLQDIVKSVIKETGFLGDVYSSEELADTKDKEKKVAFLKKLISATQDATGMTVSARPGKIVAGLEATKTLQLLQAVAAGVALKQSGAPVKPPVIDEKNEKKKSTESSSKDPTKRPKSKKDGDEKKEDSAKEKKRKKSDNDVKKNDDGAAVLNGEKKKDKSSSEEKKKREKSAKEGVEEVTKRDKSAKDEEVKRDKLAKDVEKKKRDKSTKEGNGEKKKSDRIEVELNGENRKRGRSSKERADRPRSRKPILDGLDETVIRDDENPVSSSQNGELTSEVNVNSLTNGHEDNVVPLINGIGQLNVLEEAKENTEPQLPSVPRKSSSDISKEKTDKENQEKPDKTEKRDKIKEGSAVERKHSSRRSSSKVRPSSKTAEKLEKSGREKKEEEPTVLGTGDVAFGVPKTERPQTARKAPPSARPQSQRPPSSRPGAPKIRERGEVKTDLIEIETEVKAVAVITDSEKLQDDENTVTVERQALSPDFETAGSHFLDMANKVGENEGALVAQILETKRELEETVQIIGGDSTQRNIEIEWEGGRKQKKEAYSREIAKLREGIQQLTRATNPLGKLFDFLQEDVDSMQREIKTWKETNATYTKQLETERRLTENSLETYRRKLAELDSLIDQETETLKNMKANVLANDRKIYSILTKTSTE